jgi:hypothetical protein
MTVAKKSREWWFRVRLHKRNHWYRYRGWREWRLDLSIDAGVKARTMHQRAKMFYTWEWTRVSEDSRSIQEESFRRLSIDPREHIIKQAALPLRTMRSNASCSGRPCKPETTKQGIVKPVWRPKKRQESLACSRNCTHVHNMETSTLFFWIRSRELLFCRQDKWKNPIMSELPPPSTASHCNY